MGQVTLSTSFLPITLALAKTLSGQVLGMQGDWQWVLRGRRLRGRRRVPAESFCAEGFGKKLTLRGVLKEPTGFRRILSCIGIREGAEPGGGDICPRMGRRPQGWVGSGWW